jgi:hypothetical protein
MYRGGQDRAGERGEVVGVRVPPEAAEALRRIAEARGVTVSDVVRPVLVRLAGEATPRRSRPRVRRGRWNFER